MAEEVFTIPSKVHYSELDGMRGVLAVTVMLFHFGLNVVLEKISFGFLHDGLWAMSVDFFFILSGFVLCRSFLLQPVNLQTYALKRLARLAPLALLTLAIAWFFTQSQWTLGVVTANGLMVQSLLGLKSINFPAWSVPFELLLPAFILPVVGYIHHAGYKLAAPLTAAGLLAACTGVVLLAYGADIPWLRAIAGLATGAAFYICYELAPPKRRNGSTVLATLFFVLAIGVMAISGAAPLMAILFPPLTLASIWFGASTKGLLSTPPFQALGRWSYAIYMLHIPVLIVAQAWFGETAGRDPFSKLMMISVVVLISAASFRFIELPFIRYGALARPRALPLPTK